MPEEKKTESPSKSTPSSVTRSERSYNRLWWYTVLLTSLVSLTPLIVMTFVHTFQYKKAVQTELILPITRLLSNTKYALESVISERVSALRLLFSEKSFDDLKNDVSLNNAFIHLKESFGGFIDLGLIDSKGNQVSYIGPYDLKGKNYADQEWFHEVSLRDLYLSDVFMGFRNFPHFIIAVKRDSPGGGFYVLRATIDMRMLDRQIGALNLGPSSDNFIISREGILQTVSKSHGELLQPCSLPTPDFSAQAEVTDQHVEKGQTYILGYAFIEGSPFILITVQNRSDLMKNWMALKNDPIWFLIGSSTLILIVVLGGAAYMVNRVRMADSRRAKMFHNLEYTNKMASIGRLAASVAHEINNPLAIINEKAGLLMDIATFTEGFPQKEKIANLVDSILKSVDRCSVITHRLLGFARRMDVRKELLDLGLLLKEVMGFLDKDVRHRNITIELEVPEDFPTIESDRGQLQQVFLNIINNAFAAVPDGGLVRISLREQDDFVAVMICDNGSGISKEDLKHIFEPFFSTKGEFGTGLGLSITYGIVEKLGGDISVESELGKRTCFTVSLPRKKG
ncbi:MAG: ATP-binding protein [bacterium]